MTYPTKFSNQIGTRPATKVTRGPTVSAPTMGAPLPPVPNQDGTHGYLKMHKKVFPAGYVASTPDLAQTERSTQGMKGSK